MAFTANELAQQQLDAYNIRDIERFLSVYSEDVTVMEFPSNKVIYTGKEEMRLRYSKLFLENPNQHAKLVSRMTKGNIVIDHELVEGRANGVEVYAIAIYEEEENIIKKVWFAK